MWRTERNTPGHCITERTVPDCSLSRQHISRSPVFRTELARPDIGMTLFQFYELWVLISVFLQYHGLTIYTISAFVCCSIAAVGGCISQFPRPLSNHLFLFLFYSPPHLGPCNNFRCRSPQHVATQIFRSSCTIHADAVRNLV